jgi:hypothetical protein
VAAAAGRAGPAALNHVSGGGTGTVAGVNNAIAPARTVCHGCRAVSYETVSDDDGTHRQRPVILVGDGQLMREIMPGMMVGRPCPVCGQSDDGGWVTGFVVPA